MDPLLSISGWVTYDNDVPISGVTISTNGRTATTNNDGSYTLNELEEDTYTLTPSKEGLSFLPETRQVTLPPSASGQDFIVATGDATLQVDSCIPGKYFLRGAHVQNRYDAYADWGEGPPGYVDFTLNESNTRLDGSSNPVSKSYDMGGDLNYSQDTDDDFSTSSDQELFQISWNGTTWGRPTRLTNDSQADNSPTLFYDSAGQPRLLWMKDDTLHALMGDLTSAPEQVIVENSAAMLDYQAVQDDSGNLSLFWQGYSEEGVDTFYTVYEQEHNLFGEKIQLTHDEPLEKFMAPAISEDGDLLMAYNKTALMTETITISPTLVISNVTTFGQTDLNFLTHTFGPDLSLQAEDLTITPSPPAFGRIAQLNATLHNSGDRAVVNPTVNFYLLDDSSAGKQLIETTTTALTIASGMTTTLSIDWSVPESGDLFTIVAVTDPDNTIAELDENNNSASITIEGAIAEDSFSGSIYLPLIMK